MQVSCSSLGIDLLELELEEEAQESANTLATATIVTSPLSLVQEALIVYWHT